MIIWIDAQVSPALAPWITKRFSVESHPLRDLGLRDAEDTEIFFAAKETDAVVMTKDRDFVELIDRFGAPPQVIWITCGNTSNERLKQVLNLTLRAAIRLLRRGEPLVEIDDPTVPPR